LNVNSISFAYRAYSMQRTLLCESRVLYARFVNSRQLVC